MKIQAISVLGMPYSGKSSVLKPYLDDVFYMGNHLRNLPENSEIEKLVRPYVSIGIPVPSNIFKSVVDKLSFDENKKIIFDGTPRSLEQFEAMQNRFNFAAGIEIVVNPIVWEERIKSVSHERTDRTDSTLELSKKRKEVYEIEIEKIRPKFGQWYQIDGSGSIEDSAKEFEEVLKTLNKL